MTLALGRRAPFVHRLRVRYHECDAQGVVFNANYVAYFDVTLTELWREAFGSYAAMYDSGVDLVVAEIGLRYHAAAAFDDEIDVCLTITRLGVTGMTSSIEIRRGEDLLVAGFIRHVFVAVGTSEKVPIPDEVRASLAPWVVEDASDGHPRHGASA
ncbi:acyl-CoA thioesterase [Paraconexibacter sp.]|uniref:acyl-CoA thioesterase n=1 Tax=Paraconexibacter sp. TaxID=2949640 RepID=UPI0035665553